jgi:hypothetical protein
MRPSLRLQCFGIAPFAMLQAPQTGNPVGAGGASQRAFCFPGPHSARQQVGQASQLGRKVLSEERRKAPGNYPASIRWAGLISTPGVQETDIEMRESAVIPPLPWPGGRGGLWVIQGISPTTPRGRPR